MRKFSDGNPLVLLAYFSAAAGIAMFTMHPVLLGLFILIKAEWVVSFLQVLLAVMVILNGALAIYESFFFKNLHMSYWWTALLYGVLAAAAGIVALCNPFATVLVLTRVLGVMLLLSSAADVLILYRVRKDMENNQYTRIVIK